MRRVLAAAVAAVAVAVTTGCASEQPPAMSQKVAEYYEANKTLKPAPPQQPVIAFLGDSYVNGSKTVPVTDTYAARAAIQLGVLSKPYGAGGIGYTIGNGRGGNPIPAYVSLVVADKPTYVVVQGGLNELGQNPPAMKAAALKTLRDLRNGLPKTPIVVVGPFDKRVEHGFGTLASRDAVKAAAAETGVPFIDPIAEEWFTGPTLLDPDGVHLTPEGRTVYASKLVPALKRLGIPKA